MHRKRAVGWAYALTWGKEGIRATTTVVLAAIVGPAEFGVMALALIYIGFIEMMLQQGFVAAIIQRKVLRHAHVTSAFWLMIGFSLLLAGAGILFGRYWAAANKAPVLASVIPVLSASIPLVAMGTVPTALLTRHFKMKVLTLRSITAATVSTTVAIPMALTGFGVWSLVALHLCFTLTNTVFVLGAARWRPRLEFNWPAARELLPFSFANFGARTGGFFAVQMDAIVIGLFWGPAAVGLYRLADRCVAMTLELVSGPLQFVSFPEFSKLQDNPDRFRQSFVSYVRVATLVTWPALAILAVSAGYIPALLGTRWAGIEYAVGALAICGGIQTLTQFIGPLLQSAGRPGTLARILWFQGVLGAVIFAAVGSLVAEATMPVQTASIGIAKGLLFALLLLTATLWYSLTLLRLPVRTLATTVLPTAVCAAGVYVVGVAGREGLGVLGVNDIMQVLFLLPVLGLASLVSAVAVNGDLRLRVVTAVRAYSPLSLRP